MLKFMKPSINGNIPKVQLNTYDNTWYKPGGSNLKRLLWYFINITFFKNAWIPVSNLKVGLLRLFGAKIGKGVNIKPNVNIKYPWFLKVGDNCWIGEGVWIDNLTLVTLGNNVCVSQGAFLLTGNHNYKTSTFDLMVGEITLEDGVWIGAKAIVCPNVICKTHSVLSAGSVTSKDLEPYLIYQGNPAIAIRERNLIP
jgi:putative colanic acid biosynthesis acetyltransferase WcaF